MKPIPKKDIILVTLQLCLFVGYSLPIELFPISHGIVLSSIGLFAASTGIFLTVLSILQLRNNLSPFPSPKSKASLIQHGIYSYIRHPIYTGILIAAFGYSLYEHSLFKILISIISTFFFYYKSVYEEAQLCNIFSEYSYYQKHTGRLLPKFKKSNKN